jgi:hypothetical protein
MGFVYCLLLIGAGFALWGMISPRSSWRVLRAWQYKNPEPTSRANPRTRWAGWSPPSL